MSARKGGLVGTVIELLIILGIRQVKCGSFYNRPTVAAGWSAHDVANAAGLAFRLPPELFEKNVWAGDGTRTVFTDQDGNVVM